MKTLLEAIDAKLKATLPALKPLAAALAEAVWDAATMNDLPDSAFLFIESGGSKDDAGKTTPRSLRHFPVMMDGKVDLAHLRNALARIPQSSLTESQKATALKKAKALAADNGVAITEAKPVVVSGRRWIIEAMADQSLNDRMDKVASAVRATYGMQDGLQPSGMAMYAYAQAVFDGYVIVKKCGPDGEELYRVDYHFDANGDVVFDGDPVEQELVYQNAPAEPGKESRFREGRIFGPLTEAGQLDTTTTPSGKKWGVLIIQEGMSANRNRYSRAVLKEASPLYEGAKIYLDHEDQPRYGRSTKNVAGFLKDVAPVILGTKEAQGSQGLLALAATAVITKPSVRQELLDAYQEGNRELFGLSHDVLAESITVASPDGPFYDIRRIESVRSVDLVTNPAAGGRILRLVASATIPQTLEGDGRMLQKMIDQIKAKGTATAKAALEALGATPNEDQVMAIFESAFTPAADPKKAVTEAKVEPTGAKKVEVTEADMATMQGHLLESRREGISLFLQNQVTDTSLPKALKDKIRKRFDAQITEAKAIDAMPSRDAITAAIKEEVEVWGQLVESKVVVPGQGGSRVEVGAGAVEKREAMLDDFFAVKKQADGTYKVNPAARAMSFRNLYIDITGDANITGHVKEAKRLTESLTTASFDQIFGDSITRRMLADYAASDKANWRGTIAEVVPVSDFRTQRRMRFGGYGNLSTVGQGAPYPALTSPTDEEATYAPAKRGGTEQLTIEMIANDDVGAIRRIPQRLANAAAQTLYEFVWDFLANNGLIYDGVALAAGGHGSNLISTALSAANLSAMRLVMKKQTDMSNGKRVGLSMKYLIVPSDLEELAFQLTTSDKVVNSANNDPNFLRKLNIQPIVVDYWTDVNNYWGAADPTQSPMIEIGFWGGREDPELLVQDTPTQGSLFSNDVLTYKIRHVYGGAVLDFRPFVGAVVA